MPKTTDYEFIARVLRDRMEWAQGIQSRTERESVIYAIQGIVSQFAANLASKPLSFDRERFIAACMGE